MVALAPSNPALLWDGGGSTTTVVVHPLVLLHVLDHHTRRQEASGRVIGTLLGRREEEHYAAAAGNSSEASSPNAATSTVTRITVTNCFAVPHAERGDEVAIGKDFNKQMLALHRRSSQRGAANKEVVVGWYATAFGSDDKSREGTPEAVDATSQQNALIADTSSLIHEFYAGETEDDQDPIHLVFDTRLWSDTLPITAYKSTAVTIQGDGEPMGNLFHQVPLALQNNAVEKICLQEMIQANTAETTTTTTTETPKVTADEKKDDQLSASADDSAAGLQQAMQELHDLLTQTLTYVDQVVEGSIPLEQAEGSGRRIADCLETIPRLPPELWDNKLFHQALQDLLMVTALSNMTRTQVTLAEKLNASLGKV